MTELSSRETAGVYLMLKKAEQELDLTLCRLLNRIEKKLYARLNIDELENLEELYRQGSDFSGCGGNENEGNTDEK